MSQARKIPMRKCIGCQEMKSKKEINYLISFILYSASRTRTYDIMINSHALLPTELWRINAKRLPYLTGGNPQLHQAY